jgi:hypothetical protein
MPVVAESIHRLSVLNDKKSNKVFAQTNFLRWLDCSFMGLWAPLMYQAIPMLPFYFVALDSKINYIYRESKLMHGPQLSFQKLLSIRSQRFSSTRSGDSPAGNNDKKKSIIARLSTVFSSPTDKNLNDD